MQQNKQTENFKSANFIRAKPSTKRAGSALKVIHTVSGKPQKLKQIEAVLSRMHREFSQKNYTGVKLKNLYEAEIIGESLANFFPDPLRAKLGIMELLINAIEHGNLEITSEEKANLIKENRWMEEINRRLNLEEYRQRQVQVSCSKSHEHVEIFIKDEGKGFNWHTHLEVSDDAVHHLNGRGIACAHIIGFDTLQYMADGSEVLGKQMLK